MVIRIKKVHAEAIRQNPPRAFEYLLPNRFQATAGKRGMVEFAVPQGAVISSSACAPSPKER